MGMEFLKSTLLRFSHLHLPRSNNNTHCIIDRSRSHHPPIARLRIRIPSPTSPLDSSNLSLPTPPSLRTALPQERLRLHPLLPDPNVHQQRRVKAGRGGIVYKLLDKRIRMMIRDRMVVDYRLRNSTWRRWR